MSYTLNRFRGILKEIHEIQQSNTDERNDMIERRELMKMLIIDVDNNGETLDDVEDPETLAEELVAVWKTPIFPVSLFLYAHEAAESRETRPSKVLSAARAKLTSAAMDFEVPYPNIEIRGEMKLSVVHMFYPSRWLEKLMMREMVLQNLQEYRGTLESHETFILLRRLISMAIQRYSWIPLDANLKILDHVLPLLKKQKLEPCISNKVIQLCRPLFSFYTKEIDDTEGVAGRQAIEVLHIFLRHADSLGMYRPELSLPSTFWAFLELVLPKKPEDRKVLTEFNVAFRDLLNTEVHELIPKDNLVMKQVHQNPEKATLRQLSNVLQLMQGGDYAMVMNGLQFISKACMQGGLDEVDLQVRGNYRVLRDLKVHWGNNLASLILGEIDKGNIHPNQMLLQASKMARRDITCSADGITLNKFTGFHGQKLAALFSMTTMMNGIIKRGCDWLLGMTQEESVENIMVMFFDFSNAIQNIAAQLKTEVNVESKLRVVRTLLINVLRVIHWMEENNHNYLLFSVDSLHLLSSVLACCSPDAPWSHAFSVLQRAVYISQALQVALPQMSGEFWSFVSARCNLTNGYNAERCVLYSCASYLSPSTRKKLEAWRYIDSLPLSVKLVLSDGWKPSKLKELDDTIVTIAKAACNAIQKADAEHCWKAVLHMLSRSPFLKYSDRRTYDLLGCLRPAISKHRLGLGQTLIDIIEKSQFPWQFSSNELLVALAKELSRSNKLGHRLHKQCYKKVLKVKPDLLRLLIHCCVQVERSLRSDVEKWMNRLGAAAGADYVLITLLEPMKEWDFCPLYEETFQELREKATKHAPGNGQLRDAIANLETKQFRKKFKLKLAPPSKHQKRELQSALDQRKRLRISFNRK